MFVYGRITAIESNQRTQRKELCMPPEWQRQWILCNTAGYVHPSRPWSPKRLQHIPESRSYVGQDSREQGQHNLEKRLPTKWVPNLCPEKIPFLEQRFTSVLSSHQNPQNWPGHQDTTQSIQQQRTNTAHLMVARQRSQTDAKGCPSAGKQLRTYKLHSIWWRHHQQNVNKSMQPWCGVPIHLNPHTGSHN